MDTCLLFLLKTGPGYRLTIGKRLSLQLFCSLKKVQYKKLLNIHATYFLSLVFSQYNISCFTKRRSIDKTLSKIGATSCHWRDYKIRKIPVERKKFSKLYNIFISCW